MKHFVLAIITVTVLFLTGAAHAHDPMAELEASVKASNDAAQGQINNLNSTIDELFEALDALSARQDAIESSSGSMSSAIDDLYSIIDALSTALSPEQLE